MAPWHRGEVAREVDAILTLEDCLLPFVLTCLRLRPESIGPSLARGPEVKRPKDMPRDDFYLMLDPL